MDIALACIYASLQYLTYSYGVLRIISRITYHTIQVQSTEIWHTTGTGIYIHNMRFVLMDKTASLFLSGFGSDADI